MRFREIVQVVTAQATSDGAGVRLNRAIGTQTLDMLDPFLLFDEFGSDNPDDYIAGFPSHPHRGFETVTYQLAGRMRHRDSAGHEGLLEPGAVQWMTAGRGIVHSEVPEQEQGLLSGIQLWINLPAAAKLGPPKYQEFTASQIPEERPTDGVCVRIIAGRTAGGAHGPVEQSLTDPTYLDVRLVPGSGFEHELPDQHNAFLYVLKGSLQTVGEGRWTTPLHSGRLAVLGAGNRAAFMAGESDTQVLLIAGRPLGEPVAREGPFVMNTRGEIRQAFEDYQSGRLGQIPGE